MENTRKIIGLTIIFLWSLCIVFILILMAIGLIDVDKGIEILKSFIPSAIENSVLIF